MKTPVRDDDDDVVGGGGDGGSSAVTTPQLPVSVPLRLRNYCGTLTYFPTVVDRLRDEHQLQSIEPSIQGCAVSANARP